MLLNFTFSQLVHSIKVLSVQTMEMETETRGKRGNSIVSYIHCKNNLVKIITSAVSGLIEQMGS